MGEPVSQPIVVGMGASAGGLKAFERFFASMSPESGMAFILVLHLDPSHVSLLPELLSKYTKMTVLQAKHGAKVAANTIYIIPPNKKMAIAHGALVLSEPTERRGLRLPIDAFLRSLAADQGRNAVGVILSGTGTDGTQGLLAIKNAGGLVIVQELASAEFAGMPRSAVETGLADYVLAPDKIAEQLLNVAHGPRLQASSITAAHAEASPETLDKILQLLRFRSGHDFTAYKQSTICRRIDRRMSLLQIAEPRQYLGFLQHNPQEAAALCKDLLIGVTQFFRDPEAFKVLGRVLKQMLAKKPKEVPVRVWVPGCSSGQEVYSIAILLRECMDALKKPFAVQIFGTDIDGDAIETARGGVYSADLVKDLAPARLARFFQNQSDGYHVKKEIRELAIFSLQDLIKDPPFTKLDLLCCRNVMIYLDGQLQKRLLGLFHYALRPNGTLFLGTSESIDGCGDLFAERNRRWKIFQRRDSLASRTCLPLPYDAARTPSNELAARTANNGSRDSRLAGVAAKLLLDRYAPPCVLVNKSAEILYSHGVLGRYLSLPQGQPSLNVLAMAQGQVKNALATVVRKASTQQGPATITGVQYKNQGKLQRLSVTATPYRGAQGSGELLLIAFEETDVDGLSHKKGARPARSAAERVARLEQELWNAREQLQMTLAEKPSPDEELRSFNEELQSANEELQSMNEELETSKEELQSLNEELATINAELQGKSEALTCANDDLKNLLDSTNIATLFLDAGLCVKRITPEVTKVINLVPSDVGRPVNHFKTKLVEENLSQEAQQVLDTLIPKQSEIRSSDGQWYLMRITPYRAANNVIDGVVVTFINITDRKNSELVAEKARIFAQEVVETVREPLVVLDSGLTVVSANRAFYQRLELSPQGTAQRSFFDLNHGEWDNAELRRLLGKVLAENQGFDNFTVEHHSARHGRSILLLNARRIQRSDIDTNLILLGFEDVTDREKREALRALAARLNAVREEERSRLAREIHDELSGSLTALKMDLSLLPDRAAKDRAAFAEKLSSMSKLIDSTLEQVRTIVTELRPVVLDKLGLIPAIEWQTREFQEHTRIPCEVRLPAEDIALEPGRATALFRILQEALTNIARHAQASKVVIELQYEAGSLILLVRDDGKGVEAAAIDALTSLGLLGIRERALSFGGSAEIAALPERGTCVTVRMPIKIPGTANS